MVIGGQHLLGRSEKRTAAQEWWLQKKKDQRLGFGRRSGGNSASNRIVNCASSKSSCCWVILRLYYVRPIGIKSSKLRKRLKCKKTLGGRKVGRLIQCNLSGDRDRCDIGARRSPREKMIMLLKTPWGHPFPLRFFCSSTKVSGNRHACQTPLSMGEKAKAKHNDTGRSHHSDRSVSYSKNNKLQWLFNINKTDTFIGWVWSAWRQH